MFSYFPFACLCGLSKQLTVNFYNTSNVRISPILSEVGSNFPFTSMGQVSYNRFNATACLSRITVYKSFPQILPWKGCDSKLGDGAVTEGCFCLCKENEGEIWKQKSAPCRASGIQGRSECDEANLCRSVLAASETFAQSMSSVYITFGFRCTNVSIW